MDYGVITLEIAVALLATVLLILAVALPGRSKAVNGIISIVALLGILIYSFTTNMANTGSFFMGLYSGDALALYFKQLFLIAAILVTVISMTSIKQFEGNGGEFFSVLVFALLGMMVMVSANDSITFYIGLELMTISFVILTAYDKKSLKSAEAGLKYILLSAISSGVLLYGLSILYGLAGSTLFADLLDYTKGSAVSPVFVVAVIMLLAGFGFKISAVPFHMWTPDIYEGAPTPITAFLATGSKAAAFAALIRVLIQALPNGYINFIKILILLAVLTIVIGNLIAIPQRNIKRMLAYSSISHAGYILLGLVSFTKTGISAMLYYIFIYIFATIGAFVSVLALSNQTRCEEIAGFKGMWKRSPLIMAVLMISLLSMAGIPPAAGFIGKFYLFASIINQGFLWLALLAIGMSVVSIYYYIMVIRAMLTPLSEGEDASGIRIHGSLKLVMIVSAAVTLFLGIYAAPLTDWTNRVTELFIR